MLAVLFGVLKGRPFGLPFFNLLLKRLEEVILAFGLLKNCALQKKTRDA
jgi:hypothetical protein